MLKIKKAGLLVILSFSEGSQCSGERFFDKLRMSGGKLRMTGGKEDGFFDRLRMSGGEQSQRLKIKKAGLLVILSFSEGSQCSGERFFDKLRMSGGRDSE